MSLYDFFFPEQAQASHLRELAKKKNSSEALAAKRADYASREVEKLAMRLHDAENNLAFISLLLASIMEVLEQKGSMTREELKKKIEELDWLDGFKDGQLDIGVLRQRAT